MTYRDFVSYDKTKDILIPVIASFNEKGDVMPIYFQINGETYKVLYSKEISQIQAYEEMFPQYKIRFESAGILREIKVTYHTRGKFWTMPKKIL